MDKIQELIDYSHTLYDRGLVHASGGNTSIRVGNDIYITRTDAVLGELTVADITRMDLDGEVIEGQKPSKEWPMHLALFKARPDDRAIIHIHPTYSIAFSTLLPDHTLDAVPAYTSALYRHAGRVPMINYYPVGSKELHHAIAELAPHFHAILLRQHGITVSAATMPKAMGIVEEIEQCCQVALLTNLKGDEISDEEKTEIDRLQGRSWPTQIN